MRRGWELWAQYEAETASLAMQLCEQLRLILEPTLTDRLEGDYKTGKRINMKKVIPYIASGFKKDKIWLRRTKPSKRQYQVWGPAGGPGCTVMGVVAPAQRSGQGASGMSLPFERRCHCGLWTGSPGKYYPLLKASPTSF